MYRDGPAPSLLRDVLNLAGLASQSLLALTLLCLRGVGRAKGVARLAGTSVRLWGERCWFRVDGAPASLPWSAVFGSLVCVDPFLDFCFLSAC